MQWKAHKVSLQTPWASPWNFPWILVDLRWASTASWCPQATLGMRLWCTCGVHWWNIFSPHPAALIPTVSIPSGRCGSLYSALLRYISSFWWSWGEWHVVGHGDRHIITSCDPGLWWSGFKYFQSHVCPWGSTGMVKLMLRSMCSARIDWDEDWFPPGTLSKYLPWWILNSRRRWWDKGPRELESWENVALVAPVAPSVPAVGLSLIDAMVRDQKRVYRLFTCLLVLLS